MLVQNCSNSSNNARSVFCCVRSEESAFRYLEREKNSFRIRTFRNLDYPNRHLHFLCVRLEKDGAVRTALAEQDRRFRSFDHRRITTIHYARISTGSVSRIDPFPKTTPILDAATRFPSLHESSRKTGEIPHFYPLSIIQVHRCSQNLTN